MLTEYFSRDEKLSIILERAQYIEIRIALGYRITTSTNAMIAEAGIMLLKDRVSYLVENFMLKTLAYGRKDLKDKIDRLTKEERLRGFIGNRMEVIAEA